MTSKDMTRFWNFVDKTETCWFWTGGTSRGYGRFWLAGRTPQAHRVAFEDAHGPIPVRMVLDHLCRNRNCVRPDHLEVVTPGENVLRGVGLSAENKRKSSCKAGHPLSGDNLYIDPRDQRVCVTCQRARVTAWRKRKAA